MNSQLLAGISLSAVFHAGAAMVIGAWLSKQDPGLPDAAQGIAEVVFAVEFGPEQVARESASFPAQEAEPEMTSQPPTSAPVVAADAPPAPVIEEAPRAMGPPEPASPPTKIVPQISAVNSSQMTSGSSPVHSSGGAARGGPRGVIAAKYRARASLSYPGSALRDQAGGRVLLLVEVDEAGKATRVTVKQSSGRSDLDAAAVSCARQSSYEPYRVGGAAQSCLVEAPFEFQLTGTQSHRRVHDGS